MPSGSNSASASAYEPSGSVPLGSGSIQPPYTGNCNTPAYVECRLSQPDIVVFGSCQFSTNSCGVGIQTGQCPCTFGVGTICACYVTDYCTQPRQAYDGPADCRNQDNEPCTPDLFPPCGDCENDYRIFYMCCYSSGAITSIFGCCCASN